MHSHTSRFVSCLPAILLISACANMPQSRQLIQHPPADIARFQELKGVPFLPQEKYQCGPAALATILRNEDVQVSPDELTDKVYLPTRRGSLQVEMIATARSYGLLSYKIKPELHAILMEVSHGNPVLVFQNLAFSFWPRWHYAVVVGYDLNRSVLLLRSGTIKNYGIDFSTFERTWKRADHWAYVLLKPGKVPVTAQPLEYTRASQSLLTSAPGTAALEAFRAGAKRWPQESIVLMALGNAEFAAGHYARADQAFSVEIGLRRDNAAAWNNLAYAMAARSCGESANRAIQCALQLAPNDQNLHGSAIELGTMGQLNTGTCEIPDCSD